MKLTALRLFNVRRFADRGIAIENIGDGVNVLCAVNEFGKSTLFDALHALFFQPHTGTPGAVQSLRPYSGGSPLVEADIVTADGRWRLSKQFYGGRRAAVSDIGSGRLIAQADEAERIIANLVHGGAGGPAGLLWVRQGNTGLEKRSKSDEEGELRAREDVLSSVQGEVEELTGGRRMAEAMAACEDELAPLVTATGRPKAGGPYALAIDERDRCAAEEARLQAAVEETREALEARRKAKARLGELEDPAEEAARKHNIEEAEKGFQSAQSHQGQLEKAEAEAALLRSKRDEAAGRVERFGKALAEAGRLRDEQTRLMHQRDEALERQLAARTQSDATAKAVDTAEREEKEARDLLARLERAMRAREAAERVAGRRETLAKAEAERSAIEEGRAVLRKLAVPDDILRGLEDLETEMAGLRAAAAARASTVSVEYVDGSTGAVSMQGKTLDGGTEYPLSATSELELAGIGSLTFRSNQRDAAADELGAAEGRRRQLLQQIGVDTLAEARERAHAAGQKKGEIDLAQQRLDMLAPDGIDALRDELASVAAETVDAGEAQGDPEQVKKVLEAADHRVTASRNAVRECRSVREVADHGVVEAEKSLAAVTGELARIDGELGPQSDRAAQEVALATALAEADGAFNPAQARLVALREASPDMAAAEAALARARSVVDAVAKETARLREQIADLNGRIRTRSDEAIEEAWREAAELRAAAEAEVVRWERQVALLQRLRAALDAARIAARDHYFAPVLSELRPLMGLLFDDVSIAFDDKTLLPQTLLRDGLVEKVEHLSGGMREQLAVLTRLAFARLLAKDGHPTPVILDDALVYSDDDRIEKIFDALHRQSRDQQIIVFSCRQRAFTSLGGNRLERFRLASRRLNGSGDPRGVSSAHKARVIARRPFRAFAPGPASAPAA